MKERQIKFIELLLETHFSYKVYQRGDELKQGKSESFVNDFIDAFSIITEFNIREEYSLYQNVMSHISLMLARVTENNQARNPLVSQITEEYEEVTKICRIICWILEKKFSLPEISIDEICYLALYIQGEIMEQEENAVIMILLFPRRIWREKPGIYHMFRY